MTLLVSKRQNTASSLYSTSALLSHVFNPPRDGSIPFLDTLFSPGPDNPLLTTVYRKPTNTDQYLHWNSHYNFSTAYSGFKNLIHKAKTFCTNPQLLHKEEEHVWDALIKCRYSTWTLNRLKTKKKKHWYSITQAHNSSRDNITITNNNQSNHSNIHKVVPYTKSLTKSFKNICFKVGIQVHFKGGNTIKSPLVTPRERNNITQRSEVIYRYRCDWLECNEEFIGESARTFW